MTAPKQASLESNESQNKSSLTMAYLLGWKDILRPIRDGYRHLFPAPDTGPTPEERRKQRELDRLKGFAYFDTFDQVETWTEADCDPLQRANTPLLQRKECDTKSNVGNARVLLIHDYSGNYHDYESVQAIGVEKDFYSCEYLQFVDAFIYFSHKLACVPPPTWTNTLHRNGVEALGTILIEPQTGGSERLLEYTTKSGILNFPMAKKLAYMATHFGFDGWLMNIEKPFPNGIWRADILEAFLRQLKAELGESKRLIWYDALTISNKIAYQNTLNSSNFQFATACGSILTNYCWKEVNAEQSLQLALEKNLLPQHIFFGIDVWAQNKSSFTHPRVTYPEYGGGGTKTGVAVDELSKFGLSAGIFAPAWSHEHFPGEERAVERALWEGTPIAKHVKCTCGDCASRHQSNKDFAIIKNATEWAAGSEHFFYTDFSRAFRTHTDEEKDIFDGHSRHAQLGSQSVLPRPIMRDIEDQDIEISYRFLPNANSACLVIEATQKHLVENKYQEYSLLLYTLNMSADNFLQFETYTRSTLPETSSVLVSLYLKTSKAVRLLPIPKTARFQWTTNNIQPQDPEERIEEIGVHATGLPRTEVGFITQLLEIAEIRIAPRTPEQPPRFCSINQIRVEHRGEGEARHPRLCWNYDVVEKTKGKVVGGGVPCSEITGPFSYFSVRVDGVELGRVYGMECVLNSRLIARVTGREVQADLRGVSFDGLLSSFTQARQLHASMTMTSPLKRKAEIDVSSPKPKKQKNTLPAYHLTPSRRDESGEAIWPARKEQIDRARQIIREWYGDLFATNAEAQKPTVILPDKDADGLSSGAILKHTLIALGLSPDLISVYFPPKGFNVHDECTKEALTARAPSYIFVLDQGSRRSPPLIDLAHTCLVIDHHFAEEGGFPEGSDYVTAHDCPPVATSALLTYNICLPLHTVLSDKISWLAALGTHGDLGTTIKWEPPFPDMVAMFKQYTKKAINEAVTLVNAPRRSAAYNVEDAWAAVISAESPREIPENKKLHEASSEVRRETDLWTHTAPKFSADGTIAVLIISSAAQIHPLIATRWSSTLKSNKLEIVMCANEGYFPDKVNFSCRVARCARARESGDKVDIIKKLESIVAGDADLRTRLGESFARGHKEASGGIVGKQEWEEFKKLMGVGEATKKAEATAKEKPTQNTLENYFGKSTKAQEA
ncbi:dhh family [Pyrenophora seminiperda CCB06]|uniref:Dhh family n=1 Tax=Pyrenophora seminiperda CCB06 TaxID=1302712 RepID=A0A3M7LXU0_9PLEO|nr:dhh family [Pyrenophora seminiperda CCB06]